MEIPVTNATASILVVDDEPEFLRSVEKILRKEGFFVVTAEGGGAAIQELARRPFDLVLTDLRMPGLSGQELLEAIHDASGGTAVVIVTAYGDVDSYLELMTRGAYDYLLKPIRKEELLRVVGRVIGRRNSAPPVAG
jgi:DNA-binding NtrC family response regulator